MPIYEYSCPKCKKEVEVIQKAKDRPPLCECDNVVMHKKLSLTGGFKLRGTGWYKTDYADKGKK